MLTTVDNPYDPRTDFMPWYRWDVGQGYNTCSYLARVAHLSDDWPEEVQDAELEDAMDEIIMMHSEGLYVKLRIDPKDQLDTISTPAP